MKRIAKCLVAVLLLGTARSPASTHAAGAPALTEKGWSSSWTGPQDEQQRRLREIVTLWAAAAKSGNYQAVLARCDREIRARPHSAVGYTLRGAILGNAGRYAAAKADFTRSLTLAARNNDRRQRAALLYNRAQCSWRLRQWQAAMTDLRASMRAADNNVLAANDLAWILATCPDGAARNGVEALAIARKVCAATQHKNIVFLDTLAAGYAETGDYAAACKVENRVASALRAFDGKPQAAPLQRAVASHLAAFQQRRPWHDEPAP